MPKRTSKTGSELFIVDNSDDDWKVQRYLHDWCQLSKAIDIATGYFEIGGLLGLKDEWQKVDAMRILMGDEVSRRTKKAFADALQQVKSRLDDSLEAEKEKNDFLAGVPAIVEAIRSGKIRCKVYKKDKFHAKCYITHARQEVVGSFALVGSSNLTLPGITENIELNVQIAGSPVARAPGVVRGTLEQRRGRDGGNPPDHRAAHARIQPLRGLPPCAPRVLPWPQPDGQRVGGSRPGARRLAHVPRPGSLPEGGLPCPDGYLPSSSAARSSATAWAWARPSSA